MRQPRNLQVKWHTCFTLFLQDFELPLLVFSNILDFDLLAEWPTDPIIGFENDCLKLRDLRKEFVVRLLDYTELQSVRLRTHEAESEVDTFFNSGLCF